MGSTREDGMDEHATILEEQRATNRLLAGVLVAVNVIGIFSIAISMILAMLLGVTCGSL
jgi:hypothetical protein